MFHLVGQHTSQDGDDDIRGADDDVGVGDLLASEAKTGHVKVDEGIDDGETGRLEGQQELDVEQNHHLTSPPLPSLHLGLLTVSVCQPQLCHPRLGGKLTQSRSMSCVSKYT